MFARRYSLLLGIAGLALHGATWRLWTPQELFPQVPLFGFARAWPAWLDWASFAGVVAGYAAIGASAYQPAARAVGEKPGGPRAHPQLALRAGVGLLLVSYLLAVTLDQNRLQVWVWHFGIVAALVALSEPSRTAARIRLLTASIYLWSAVSKLNPAFAGSIGPMLLGGLFGAVGAEPPASPAAERMAYGLPICELAIGVAVLTPAWRAGLILSLAMHGGLLLSVGPLGLGHTTGVLLWNVFFIAKNVLLGMKDSPTLERASRARDRAGVAVLTAAVIFPAAAWFGFADPWQAWAVYAPFGTQAGLIVKADDHAGVPTGDPPRTNKFTFEGLATVAFDRWCRESLGVPLNPGQATRVGAAAAVAGRLEGAGVGFSGGVTHAGGLPFPFDARDIVTKEPDATDAEWYAAYGRAFRINMLPRTSQRLDWDEIGARLE